MMAGNGAGTLCFVSTTCFPTITTLRVALWLLITQTIDEFPISPQEQGSRPFPSVTIRLQMAPIPASAM